MYIFATGGPSNFLEMNNMKYSALKLLNEAILGFVGITALEPFIAYSAAHISNEER